MRKRRAMPVITFNVRSPYTATIGRNEIHVTTYGKTKTIKIDKRYSNMELIETLGETPLSNKRGRS